MALVSNCCGAPAKGGEDYEICSECSEHCEYTEELDEDERDKLIKTYEEELKLQKFIMKDLNEEINLLKDNHEKIEVTIKCPECDLIQPAVVEKTMPFYTYIHICTQCNYTIMEGEWCEIINQNNHD